MEQHDQFCFALEGMASKYYTLLLETDPGVHLGPILRKFEKRFGSSAPDLTHQLNFQSAVQGSGESLRQWSDRVLTLATRAFPQLPDVHAQAIPRLCYEAEDKDAGMYALEGQPKTVEEAVDRMQFFKHWRQGRPLKPQREVRAVASEEEPQRTGDGRPSREIRDLQSRIKELERALQERPPVQPNPPRTTSPPQGRGRGKESPRLLQMRGGGTLPAELPL